jgi:hypothetical protein
VPRGHRVRSTNFLTKTAPIYNPLTRPAIYTYINLHELKRGIPPYELWRSYEQRKRPQCVLEAAFFELKTHGTGSR